MGSELKLTAAGADERAALRAFEAVAEFEHLESLMSVWRSGSDIARLNDAAGTIRSRSARRFSKSSRSHVR
jgi:thiamine biosynthesis lipoprotein ApbE